MAREDFCFTYYDGDAARDKAHMTRLDRGAYDDIISAQRKFGRLTLDQIKRVLGRDFEECWPSIELILKADESGKFYIEWVEKSVLSGKAFSKTQKEKSDEYWRKRKEKELLESRGIAGEYPSQSNRVSTEYPLEDGDEDVFVLKNKKGVDENFVPSGIVAEMSKKFVEINPKYPVDRNVDFPQLLELAEKISDYAGIPGDIFQNGSAEKIKLRWGEIVVHVRGDSHLSKYSISQINKHFQSVIQSLNNGTHKRTSSGGGKSDKNRGADQLLDSLEKDLNAGRESDG